MSSDALSETLDIFFRVKKVPVATA